MTIARLLPLHVHGALESVLAFALMASALAFGLDAPALVTSLVLGGLILAVALATHADDHDPMPISTHVAFDLLFAMVMGVGAVAFAAVGNAGAAILLSAAAAGLTLLCSLTRYSPRKG
jgi:hypothetical protein